MTRWPLIAAVAVLGCGGHAPEADAMPSPAIRPDTVTGPVEMFGSEALSFPLIRADDGPVRLSGPFADEIGRVTGAVVAAWGMREAARPQDRLVVAGYTVVSVNGRPVHVGVLTPTATGLSLVGERITWRLANVPERLAGLAGAKVYVAGNLADGVLSVESWGVLREP